MFLLEMSQNADSLNATSDFPISPEDKSTFISFGPLLVLYKQSIRRSIGKPLTEQSFRSMF